jgi:hypothetical protein
MLDEMESLNIVYDLTFSRLDFISTKSDSGSILLPTRLGGSSQEPAINRNPAKSTGRKKFVL